MIKPPVVNVSAKKLTRSMLSYYIYRQFHVFSEDHSLHHEQSADNADDADILRGGGAMSPHLVLFSFLRSPALRSLGEAG